ncbi:MAG: primosomal protein N' [Deltaproteobacteria bacterium]|jgi:primosomal protein N' (replication factor Y)|nr:primosomal protein N' [Deltaproteobacteria bacterium]
MTDESTKYIEVAVTAPVDRPLTYLAPDDCLQPLLPGMRVLVPLGSRKITGYILSFVDHPPSAKNLKKIAAVPDERPLFAVEQVDFFRWIARYYHYPIGEVIKTALPAGLTQRSGRRVLLTSTGKSHILEAVNKKEVNRNRWLSTLLEKGEINPHMTGKLWASRERGLLKSWEEKGWVSISSEIVGGRTKIKTELCCSLNEHITPLEPLKVSEKKTVAALEKISAATNRRFVPRREVLREYPGGSRGIKSLAGKGFIKLTEQQVYRDPFGECFFETNMPEVLTTEQQKALEKIIPPIKKGTYSAFLLHGVTGSGKTEVYLQAAAKTLEQGKTILVLVPEIALATQLEAHFLGRFGPRVALLHSGLTAGQRFDQWNRILQEEADIVIGARSAVFAPLNNIGLLIVDEEHDGSFKQEEGLRYHGRDLAVLRASRSDSVVILGSATPSVTSYFHAESGKYNLLKLGKRIDDRPLPKVKVVNMQAIKTVSGSPPVFSPELINNLRENFSRGEQSLVFLNRRGFANFMICRDCGQTVQCKHCHISLTLHRSDAKLLCHYCGFTVASSTLCTKCRSTSLVPIGIGTERLEQELKRYLPGAGIARLDRDTCVKRNDYIKILKAVHHGEVDILLGTQMIAKGHHFPNVTLVGIVLADTGLGLPDFRAGERTFQLISQVAGRAGRGGKPGRVIVQTYQPEHYSIKMAQSHDYSGMYAKEIGLRRNLRYPPFSRLINLRIEGRDETDVQQTAIRLAKLAVRFQQKKQPEILGPAPAPLTRLRDRFRWQILFKAERLEILHGILHNLAGEISSLTKTGKVRISFDVDPEYMM